ncbi:MAG: hypothetical protein JWM52_771 [Candidatus Saccharibacteria bacterium]|nr:hypothetical protein [Candidatus Saccharibacteria bacterium]
MREIKRSGIFGEGRVDVTVNQVDGTTDTELDLLATRIDQGVFEFRQTHGDEPTTDESVVVEGVEIGDDGTSVVKVESPSEGVVYVEKTDKETGEIEDRLIYEDGEVSRDVEVEVDSAEQEAIPLSQGILSALHIVQIAEEESEETQGASD